MIFFRGGIMFKKIALSLGLMVFTAGAAEACPTGLRPFNKQLAGKNACVLEGTYTGTLNLDSGFNYILLGDVYIGNEKRESDQTLIGDIVPGKMVVNAGVSIFALNPSKDTTGVWTGFTDANGNPVQGDIKSFLSVTRDSTVEIRGNASAPVLMSSAQGEHLTNPSASMKRPGDWGGFVISGKAKSNKCNNFTGCTIPGEANTGWYGGDDDNHSSGIIQYLQVEYGGDRIDSEKELNGITFNSVGLGTIIENIAVLYNADDCIEFFGGAATARNIMCYKGEDDGIDTTDGARIFLQNGIVVAEAFPGAGEDNDRHMVEADSSKTDVNNQRLRSHPVLVNFTFVGDQNSQGLMLRRGTNYTLVNSVMTGVDRWCANTDSAMDLFFSTNIFAGCPAADPASQMSGNQMVAAGTLGLEGWIPQPGSSVLQGAEIMEEFSDDMDLDEAFFDVYIETDYIGAMGEEVWTDWIQTRD
jgi:hypothetical protein